MKRSNLLQHHSEVGGKFVTGAYCDQLTLWMAGQSKIDSSLLVDFLPLFCHFSALLICPGVDPWAYSWAVLCAEAEI
jgi:hypothetical protein